MGLLEDARNIQRKDPAARSVLEVMPLYQGFHILVYHRIALWPVSYTPLHLQTSIIV